jgi:hypothetical protein
MTKEDFIVSGYLQMFAAHVANRRSQNTAQKELIKKVGKTSSLILASKIED